MDIKQLTAEVLDAVRNMKKIDVPDMAKGIAQGHGLVAFDLEPVARSLYPYFPALTPLRNRIPRVGGGTGTAVNWRAITGINTTSHHIGVSEGRRNADINIAVVSRTAAYKTIGLENFVTFEADYASVGFDDMKARAVQGVLRALFLGEERMLLGGNTSLALGTTGTPTLSASGTSATLPAGTYSVIAVALTLDGFRRASLANGVVQQVSRTNMDGTTDTINAGAAQRSAAATQVVTLGQTLFASCPITRGAVGYAWYVGTAGNERLEAITTLNSVSFSAPLAGTGQLASALTAHDRSTDSLAFDGLTTQILTTGSGAYVAYLPIGTPGVGTPLTADNGRIAEIETALLWFWDNVRLSPDTMYMSARTAMHMARVVIANGGSAIVRLQADTANGLGNMTAGARIKSYLNPITNTEINVVIHPDMVDGQILFFSESVPYQLSGVGNVVQVRTRQDYYQLEWPLRTRRYEYGVYSDEVLQNYFPPAFGLIGNIAV